ncbi:oligosaccharide flippase family protein [Candidatus Roizmanbacteria bacterium]|nr:oligosaccharide flippase family protein [Candidatus Roizmanbacteria bacterium]
MIYRIKSFFLRPTSRDIIINTLGNYLNVFFSAFFVYLLVRILDPNQYGVLSVLFGIAYVLANILDFGTTATIYSYLPPLIDAKQPTLYRFIKSTFFYQTLFSTIVIAVLFVTFPYLDTFFFKTGAPLIELYLTAISVLFFIWQNFLGNCLYAAKRVFQNNVYNNVANLAKTFVIIALALTHTVTVGSIIFTFGIVGPVVFFVLVYINKKNHISLVLNAPIAREDFRFNYTLTYFVASQFFNLGLRMDLFLLSYFRPKDEVGFYGLAQKIILTIIATVISITQVISPAFSKIQFKKDFFVHVKSAALYMLLPTILFIVLAVTPNWIFFLVFTEKFVKTADITRALAIPFILYPLMSLGHLFLLYTVKKPSHILVTNVVLFLTITLGCYFFIPLYGVQAAIYSIAAAFLLSGGLLTILALYEFRKMK